MRKESFDRSRKVFVHSIPPGLKHLNLGGIFLDRRDEVNWEEWGLSEKTIRNTWQFLFHSKELETEKYGKDGDGLDNMSPEELADIINGINKNLEIKFHGDEHEVKKRRCLFPQGGRENKKRVIPRIREWRRKYGHEDEYFAGIKEET